MDGESSDRLRNPWMKDDERSYWFRSPTPTPIPSGVRELGGLQTYYAGSNVTRNQVVLVCDVYGYEDQNLRKLAREIARSGFYVVVPDFLRGDPFVPNDPGRPISKWMRKHQADLACEDLKAVCISLGYCMNWIAPIVGLAGFGWGAKVVVELLQPQPVPAFFHHVKAAVLFDPSLVTTQNMEGMVVLILYLLMCPFLGSLMVMLRLFSPFIEGVCKPVLVLGAEISDDLIDDNGTTLPPSDLLKQFKDALDTKSKVKSHVEMFPNVMSGWFLRHNENDEEAVKYVDKALKDMLDWFRHGVQYHDVN